ncbi:PREDICTED: transcriptional enhancer factor TEF-1-like isoform X2 [Priapulus caudatus]|uniref:Transcriptional enhancer factor TEF-1-like isoform X2 n=1 Tax=Priapulus caudatus TaxID=37621 RepID=A0ABM1DW67_PRICU|nr:PREDICTED: transcriptional enhancer factor TEF-1-like isoform X2 [Priapulus caudatus]
MSWAGDDTMEDDDEGCVKAEGDGKGDISEAEGIWSPDIEQSFHEALAIYPPCGRRKIILSDEGKMYGRNELIARYIKLRTGKTRTRKQVSSHIQVLARKKSRELQSKIKDHSAKERALQSLASMSSAQIVSATAIHNKNVGGASAGVMGLYGSGGNTRQQFPNSQPVHMLQQGYSERRGAENIKPFITQPYSQGAPSIPWEGCCIGTEKIRLVEFSAFMDQQHDSDSYNKHLFVHLGGPSSDFSEPPEAVDIRQIYDKFPEKKGGLRDLYEKGPQYAFFLVKFWADLNTNIQDEAGAFYGVTSIYESSENMTITCSTKVCSFGKQVVEKVETEYARFENGRFVYRIHRSPMCEYMINFVHKLKQLPEKYMMNSVLENFTVLQVVTNRDTQETLLCVALVFEVSTSEHGAQHHIYRLVKD